MSTVNEISRFVIANNANQASIFSAGLENRVGNAFKTDAKPASGKRPLPFSTKVSPPSFKGGVNNAANVDGVTLSNQFTQSALKVQSRSLATRALDNFTTSYTNLIDAIDIENFEPQQIEQYIRNAEARSGVTMRDAEKEQIRLLSKSNDEHVLRLLALELRVGIPKDVEKEALAAFGELILYRHDKETLQGFLDNPKNDPNLKAHIRTVLMMSKVENVMHGVDTTKRNIKATIEKVPLVGHLL